MLPIAFLVRVATAAETFAGNTYYVGDLHAHSGVSGDGGSSDLPGTCQSDCGTFADIFQTARDNGLDFVGVSDHINGKNVVATSERYAELTKLAIAANDPAGGFITIPSAEVWFRVGAVNLGHKNLLFFGSDADLETITPELIRPSDDVSILVESCDAVWDWADTLKVNYGDLLLVPHHPALTLPMPTDFSCTDDAYEPIVEVYSEHGSSMGDGLGYDDPWSTTYTEGTIHTALDPSEYGLQFGFIGGTDHHDSRPGETCARDGEHPTHPYGGGLMMAVLPVGTPFDRGAIRDAMIERRTLATSGPTIPVEITYSSGNVRLAGLGETFRLPRRQALDVTVDVPAADARYVDRVEIVTYAGRFNAVETSPGRFQVSIPAKQASEYAYAALKIDGDSYYAGNCDDGGADATEYIWTSPGYLSPGPDDLDHDGVSYLEGDCDDADPTRAPGRRDYAGDGIDQDCDGVDGVEASGEAAPGGPEAGPTSTPPEGPGGVEERFVGPQSLRPSGEPAQVRLVGCDAGGGAASLGAAAIALLATRRRRGR